MVEIVHFRLGVRPTGVTRSSSSAAAQQHRQPVARVARRAALLAQHERRPRPAGVELGRQLGGELARHPAELLAAARGWTAIAFGIVRVVWVAA